MTCCTHFMTIFFTEIDSIEYWSVMSSAAESQIIDNRTRFDISGL